MPIKHLIPIQESTKDMIVAGVAYSSAGFVIADFNSFLSIAVGLSALSLTGLRIYSWFDRRKKHKDKST